MQSESTIGSWQSVGIHTTNSFLAVTFFSILFTKLVYLLILAFLYVSVDLEGQYAVSTGQKSV